MSFTNNSNRLQFRLAMLINSEANSGIPPTAFAAIKPKAPQIDVNGVRKS